MARKGCRVSDIGHAVQTYVEANGVLCVRDYVGHGVGAKLHEAQRYVISAPQATAPVCCPA